MGPSFLLVVFDTAREDALRPDRAPVLADLARRGRRFLHAVAPAPWTLPSHASMLSGRRPSEHGVTGATVLGGDSPRSTRPAIEALGEGWLPEGLRTHGYATFASSANPWVGPEMGFSFGFEAFHESWREAGLRKLSSPLESSGSGGWARSLRVHARRLAGRGDGGAMAGVGALERFLDADRRPFFAFLNVMEPHAPYVPPAGFGLRGSGRLRALPAIRRWDAARMLRFSAGQEEIAERDLAILRAMYFGETAYCDVVLSRLVDALDRRGLLDETVVVVTSDHGENLGEHHRLSHVLSMHETLLHVPLVVSGPGVPPGEEPGPPVGLLGLPAMIAGLAGGRWREPDPALAVAEYESAANQVSGARRIEEQVGPVSDEVREAVRARWVAAYEGGFKYAVSSAGEGGLFDLDADPGETRDVAGEHPEVRARLAERAGPPDPGSLEAPAEVLDREIVAHLEALGYL